jgi:glycerol-3-phosphate dehydrogenase subunit B
MSRYDAVVIGAGLAGLMAAGRLAQANKKVLLVATGAGALLLASGCIDVLGYHPANATEPVENPLARLADFLAERPGHPYNVTGKPAIEAGLHAFLELTNHGSLDYRGEPDRNWRLPGPAGAVRPTCLAPASLANGELSQGGRMLIAGFNELRDFYPALISQNLNEQNLGVQATSLMIEAPPLEIADMNATPIELARAFERADFRRQVVKAVKAASKGTSRIGFPAVLGLKAHAEVLADLEKQLGQTVFEISMLPPSAPGRRLFEQLRDVFLRAGGRLILGSKVVDGTITAGRVTQIRFETTNRLKSVTANHYILASGGIYGGGIVTGADGGIGRAWEPIFGLPVAAESNRHHWFANGFIDPAGQPFASFGVQVNQRLNPVDGSGNPIAENLFVIGASLAGYDWARGRTGEGVALASAMAAVDQINRS